MAVFRKAPAEARRPNLTASAAQYTFGGAQTWQTMPEGDRRWQAEAWYQYDINGELRYATGWKGNACSQALLYAADVDPFTGKPTGPTDNKIVQTVTDSILGGPVRRPQHIRTIAVNLDVVGEVYIVVAAGTGGDADEWLVVSSTEFSKQGKTVQYSDPKTGTERTLSGNDMLIRIWMPHPRMQLNADSAVRALLPTLREIEKTSQNIAARLDSRLAGAGVLVVPSDLDFPEGDDDPAEPGGMMGLLVKSMRASMQDPGSAASQVPIVVEAPSDMTDAFNHISFETPLSKEVIELRREAIARLAAGLDLPREVVEGMGASNHWSAWQVEEATYKTHLLPLLDLISDALTVAFLGPALDALHVPDPGQYMLAFDGTALIGQPDPLAEALELFDRGIISDGAVRTITSTPEEYAPQGEERLRALAERLVAQAPTLFLDPEVRRRLGFTEDVPAVAAPQGLTAPATLPAADTSGAPARTAAGGFEAASLAVTYALERAGNKLVNAKPLKDRFAHVPRHEMHVHHKPEPERYEDLLAGAWRHVEMLAVAYDLDRYTHALLVTGTPHTDANLREWMARRG